MFRRLLVPVVVATTAFAAVAGSPARAGNPDWKRAYEAGVIGGGYAAGETIGSAALSGQGGYDGGAPVGYRGGAGPSDRPCYTRRPVYDENGTMIGFRGQQLC